MTKKLVVSTSESNRAAAKSPGKTEWDYHTWGNQKNPSPKKDTSFKNEYTSCASTRGGVIRY